VPDIGPLAIIAFGIVVVLAAVRPEATVLILGIYLFVQSAVVRVEAVPPDVREFLARLDEVVLLVLAARTAVALAVRRRLRLSPPLWAIAAFAVIGLLSFLLNRVDPAMAGVGQYLAIKPALWLFVAMHLRYNVRSFIRYGVLIGSLFVAAVFLAVIQFAGVTLPWDAHVRRSGELAATSVWNQHTVFGSAMAVMAGLAVVAARLPGWRVYAIALGVMAGVGIFLSTVRRLLAAVPLGAAAAFAAQPDDRRRAVKESLSGLRRTRYLLLIAAVAVALAVVTGPRMVRIVGDTWDEYVVHAADRDRYVLYGGSLELLGDSPLVGRGPGTYGSYASVLFESPVYAELGIHLRDGLKMGAPYASLFGEFGILGGLAFLAFIALTMRQLLPIVRARGSPLPAALASGGIFMLVDMTIESIVHVTFADSFVSFFAFGGMGAAIGIARSEEVPARAEEIAPPRRGEAITALGASIALFLGTTVLVGSVLPQSSDGRPNIVVVVMDDLNMETFLALDGRRADGTSGPTIADLVGGEGATFVNAIVSSPTDCPARTTLLVGQYAHNHGAWGLEESECYPYFRSSGLEDLAIGNWLQASGYRTGYVGRYLGGYGRDDFALRFDEPPPGWDYWKTIWGTSNYYGYRVNTNGAITGRSRSDEFYLTTVIARGALSVIRDNEPRPFFLVVAPFTPHEPNPMVEGDPTSPVPAPGDEGLYAGAELDVHDLDVAGKPAFVEATIEARRRLPAEDAEMRAEANTDHVGRLESMAAIETMVGDMVDELMVEESLENTYFIFTSDNGYHLGHHGLLPGGTGTPYTPDVHVPLMIRGPGVTPGTVRDELVSTLDIAPTIAEIAGVQPPVPQDGRSLGPLIRGETPTSWRAALLLEHRSTETGRIPSYVGIRTQRFTYVEWPDGFRERYDLRNDPGEQVNLQVEGAKDERDHLRRLLDCGGVEGRPCSSVDG